jgi:hypothetical protein
MPRNFININLNELTQSNEIYAIILSDMTEKL